MPIRLIKENRDVKAVITVGEVTTNYTSLIRRAQETEPIPLQYQERIGALNVNRVSLLTQHEAGDHN